jgi:NAD(P)-dependent dehydrogenase (short-subunit alcohol dehydrogenase family)
MRRQGRGRIVNITTMAGAAAIPHLAAYSAAKSGETALSDGMRAELARDNILVTTVTPGLIRTGSYRRARFVGKQEREYDWFSFSSSLPLISYNAAKAAHRIVEACRYGDPVLVLSFLARLLRLMNGLLPGTTARLMKLASRVLPDPAREHRDLPRRHRHGRTPTPHTAGVTSGNSAGERNLERKRSVR